MSRSAVVRHGVQNICVRKLLERWKCLQSSISLTVQIITTKSLTKIHHLFFQNSYVHRWRVRVLSSNGSSLKDTHYLHASRLKNYRIWLYQGMAEFFTELWEKKTNLNLSRRRQPLVVTTSRFHWVLFWRSRSTSKPSHDASFDVTILCHQCRVIVNTAALTFLRAPRLVMTMGPYNLWSWYYVNKYKGAGATPNINLYHTLIQY